MEGIAIYPGTFDPVTNGHLDIIQRSGEIFDQVIVAVAHNIRKSPLFSVTERMEMLKQVTHNIDGVEIDHFDGLVINYVNSRNAKVIVRGLRAVSDFEYELQMALMNRTLAEEIKTVFMMPSAEYSFLSSSIVKEIVQLGRSVSNFVPKFVEAQLYQKLSPN
ncbi:pantetheine-phosphate adenylyltransferase [candidate division KSB3 bacterium]|uniref:Phosphopantetheine adenylyltransferase n=1 Tax=candidate division KSB3 bacterium TaxID=2044937 RepID=A0A2G6E2D5_9BACT|nr:MAG: pantetheine-phosphate adenylyltransferase [candidate division KSB3 bacterium]PIE28831.1 MAG: pantetheine-phosphate adenylyltransferase [candidate division KSB3 bacterium]